MNAPSQQEMRACLRQENMRSQISDHLMADRRCFTLTEKASVNRQQLSRRASSTPRTACHLRQLPLPAPQTTFRRPAMWSGHASGNQQYARRCDPGRLRLTHPAVRRHVTHLGLEALEDRRHHLSHFLRTHRGHGLSTVHTNPGIRPAPRMHKQSLLLMFPSVAAFAAAACYYGTWVLVVKAESCEMACRNGPSSPFAGTPEPQVTGLWHRRDSLIPS